MARFTFQLIPLKQNNKMTLMLLTQHENEISIVFTFYFYSNTPKKTQGGWFEISVLFTYS